MKRIATALIVIGALLAAPLADTADAKKKRFGRYYGGVTAQGMPFVLELAGNAKAVESASVMVQGDCNNAPGIRFRATISFESDIPAFVGAGDHMVSPRRVSKSGKFSATGLGSDGFGDVTGAMSERISGRVRRNGTAAGTYQATVTLVDGNGAEVDRCDTGSVKWTAESRRGRVYAGTSSQDFPVVLELNARRNMVEDLRFGWGASCQPDGGLMFPDELSGFRLNGGSFGDVFQQVFEPQEGGSVTFDYSLDGRVASKTRASGSTSVKLTETDTAGTVTTCDTGPFSWNLRSG